MNIKTQEEILRTITFLNYHGPLFLSVDYQDGTSTDIAANEDPN
ncbi:MAG: hypothetical protein ACTSR2_14710 [Candidatus Hodarchaeales archaeon]